MSQAIQPSWFLHCTQNAMKGGTFDATFDKYCPGSIHGISASGDVVFLLRAGEALMYLSDGAGRIPSLLNVWVSSTSVGIQIRESVRQGANKAVMNA